MNSWFTPFVLFVFLNLMIGTIVVSSSLATQKQQQQQQPHQLARSPSMLQRLKSIKFNNFRSQESITNYATNPDFNTHLAIQHEQEPQKQEETHSTPQQEQQQSYFSRSPSMLERFKSINLYSYLSQESTSPSTNTTITTSTMYKTQETETETTHYSFQQTEHEQEPEEETEVEQEQQQQTLDEIYNQLQVVHVSRTKSDTKPASGETLTKLARKMKKSASAKSTFEHFEEEDIVESRRPATMKEGRAKVTEEDDDEVDAKADDFINKFKQQLKLQRIDSLIKCRGSGK